MQIIAFLDLDDTLFQTLPKCHVQDGLRPAAFARDGSALSFMTPRQHRLFETLNSIATVIPVTARNLDAFQRVDLPFSSFAILDFGGVILHPDRTPDPEWLAQVRPLAAEAEPGLTNLLERCQGFIERRRLGVRARLIRDLEMPLYVVMKHPEGDTAALDAIRQDFLAAQNLRDYFIHHNDNNLSIVPDFLGKQHAVRHLLEHQIGDDVLTLGIGDSSTDIPFMRLCDYALSPRGSQLGGLLGDLGDEA